MNADTSGQSDALKNIFIRGSLGSFSIKVISTGLGFILSLVLARLLGADGYGVYAYAIAWVTLLAVFSSLGLRSLIVRNLAIYRASSSWGLIRGMLLRSNQAVMVASLLVMALAALGGLFLKVGGEGGAYRAAFWLALLMLPLMSLTVVRQAAMQGLKHVVLSQLPEALVRPVLFLGFIGITFYLLGLRLSANSAIVLNIASTGVAFAAGSYLLRSVMPVEARTAPVETEFPSWAMSALPMLFIGGMQIINHQADIIMLGILKSPEQTGVYAICVRLAGLIAFILIAAEFGIAPMVAELYAKKEIEKLQKLIRHAARLILGISLPVTFALIIFNKMIFSLFGEEFVSGKVPLIILCAGQVVNAFFGTIGRLAMMTGHERVTSIIVAAAAIVNITLNVLLIPPYGATGAAVATAVSMLLWNAGLSVVLYRKTGILSTPI